MMPALRLATYNIHKFVGLDGIWNADRVTGVVRALGADVIAIQEFTIDESRSGAPSAQEFARATGHDVIEQKMQRRNGQIQFNLLLSRIPLRRREILALHVAGVEERGAVLVETDTTTPFRIVATHLGLTVDARSRQFETMLAALGAGAPLPLAVIGDMNLFLPMDPLRLRLRREFPGMSAPATFPSLLPLLALDRILVRPASLLQSLQTFAGSGARLASDHLPLVADIALS